MAGAEWAATNRVNVIATGAEWAATNRVNVITNLGAEMSAPLFARYREVWQRKHGDAATPRLGMGRHVVVAPTEDAAMALGRANYAVWYANLTKLWRDFGAVPFRFAPDFDEARRRGVAIAGTPGPGARGDRAAGGGERLQLHDLPADVRRDDRGGGGGQRGPVRRRGHAVRHRAGRAGLTR